MFQIFNRGANFAEVPAPGELTPLNVKERFPRLVGVTELASASLSASKVVVAGVGSVGRRIALHLARLGVQAMWLIDAGRYDDRANLITQEITPDDLGEPKAHSTGRVCKSISPATRVLAYEGKLQDLDPTLLAEADVVFLATDNLAVEVDASRMFRLLGIPIIQASVHGETLVAQVRMHENRSPDGPCLICSFGAEEYSHLNQGSVFRCGGKAPGELPHEAINVLPTSSTSFLCSLAADLALMQWTRHVLAAGPPVGDTRLQYCGYTHRTMQTELQPNERCTCPHTVLQRIDAPTSVPELTPKKLATCAGFANAPPDELAFTIGNSHFVKRAICLCGEQAADRFVSGQLILGNCESCRQPIAAQPYYTSRPTPGGDLATHWDTQLRNLGVASANWAILRHADHCVLLLRGEN